MSLDSPNMSAGPRLAATQPDMMEIIGNMIGAGLEWTLEWNGSSCGCSCHCDCVRLGRLPGCSSHCSVRSSSHGFPPLVFLDVSI